MPRRLYFQWNAFKIYGDNRQWGRVSFHALTAKAGIRRWCKEDFGDVITKVCMLYPSCSQPVPSCRWPGHYLISDQCPGLCPACLASTLWWPSLIQLASSYDWPEPCHNPHLCNSMSMPSPNRIVLLKLWTAFSKSEVTATSICIRIACWSIILYKLARMTHHCGVSSPRSAWPIFTAPVVPAFSSLN